MDNRLKNAIWASLLGGVYIFLFIVCILTVNTIVNERDKILISSIYPDLIESTEKVKPLTPIQTSNAKVVIAGTYLERVLLFDLARSKWDYEFYQWFKWDPSAIEFEKLDSLRIKSVAPIDLPFRVINGQVLEAQITNYKISPEKKQAYVLYYIRASSTQFFHPDAFPMDKHFLYIPIEHVKYDASRLKFTPDIVSSKISSRAKINGYVKGERMASSSMHTYQSAYGDPAERLSATKTFNQYRFGMKIERNGYGYYLKLFTVLLVSVLIAFLSFYAEKTDKLRITVGALFTTAANNYVLTRNIPETSTVSIAEFVDIISLVTIFIIMCDQTVLRYYTRENKVLSNYTQWTTFGITLFFYVMINILIPIISK